MDDHPPSACGNLPFGGLPTDDGARGAIVDAMWPNGSTITVGFLDGRGDPWTEHIRATVAAVAPEWSRYANIDFRFVEGPGDVSITFVLGDPSTYKSELGNWSRNARPSMWLNFSPDPRRSPPDHVRGTILHEFGHALGLIHEHHRDDRPFRWDEAAVIREYVRRTGGQWGEQQIREQIMNPIQVRIRDRSPFDADSVMIYPIPAGLAYYFDGTPFVVGDNYDLSDLDKQFIAQMYPGRSTPSPVSPPPPPVGRPARPSEPDRDLTLGSSVDDFIDSSGQERQYHFALPDDGMVRFKTEGANRLAAELYGPNSDSVRYIALVHGADGRNLSSVHVLDAGRWCLKLRAEDGATGDYRLTVKAE